MGDFDPGESDGCDEGWSEGFDDGDGGVSDGSLLGTDDGWLLGADEGLLLGADDGGTLLGGDGLLGLLLSEDGLLLGDEEGDEDGDDDGDDEGDDPLLLLDFGQQPSPSTITSHLSLSAKCLAMPYVPAGITTGPPLLPLSESSGHRMPIESTTVNVRSTGQ